MDINKFKQDSKILLQKDLKRSIENLIRNVKKGTENHNDLILLLNQIIELSKDFEAGLISYDEFYYGTNRITYSIINIINGLTSNDIKFQDEIREVSGQEIEDKIKATIERLSNPEKRKDKKRNPIKKYETDSNLNNLSVLELADILGVSVTEIITTSMHLGVVVSVNQRLDAELIELIAEEFSYETEVFESDKGGKIKSITSKIEPTTSSENKSLKLYFDLGEFNELEVANCILFLSDLYRSIGGEGLIIDDISMYKFESVSEPLTLV